MAKYCPITQTKVLYLECLECDQKNECDELSKKLTHRQTSEQSECNTKNNN